MKKYLSLLLVLILCIGLFQPVLALDETEDNNLLANAQPVTPGETVKASIGEGGDVDFYSFTLPESGRLKLDMTAYFRYNCLYFYDANGSELWKDTENEWNSTIGSRNEAYERDLLAGTYYVKVTGFRYGTNNPSTGNYTLKTEFTPAKATESEPNNSIAEANTLTLGKGVEGQIAMNDSYDVYSFTLPESGRISMELTARMKYNCLYLYNESGNELWEDTENEWNSSVGYRTDNYTIDLLPGTYFVKVTGYRYGTSSLSTGTYSFKVSFEGAKATETEPNNAIAEAQALTLGKEEKGHIGITDRYDFYSFTLPESGRVTLDMTAYMKYNCIYLYDETGASIWVDTENEWNSSVGYRSDSYTIDLLPGTYYVEITGYRFNNWDGSTGTYTFKASFEGANATETEPNNSIAEAKELIAGAVRGHIAINDRYDFYSFTLDTTTEVALSATSYMKYYSLYVYDTAGKEVWRTDSNEWNSAAGYRSDEHKFTLDAGTYYLKVTGDRFYSYNDSTGTYELSMGHEHEYEESVVPPTCTEEGYTSFTCLCGISYKEDVIPALGHSFGDWTASEEEGKEERSCSVCGEKEERDAEIEHKHNYVATVIEPGCTTRGYTEYKCDCGEGYEDLYINPTGHSYGDWTASEEEGKEERVCSACGDKEERDAEGHQHKYSYKITKPSCTEAGFTTYTCNCGESYKDDYVEAIGHDEKVRVIKAATCEETGEAEYECVRCGEKRTDVLPTIDHEFHGDSCTYCGNPAAYEEKVNINYRKIKIVLDGEEIIPCDGAGKTVEPFIMSSSGTTYLPLRAVSQALGLNVHWDGVANTVTLKSGGTVKTGAGPAGKSVGERSTYITYRNIRVFLDGKQLRLVNSLGVAVEPFILNSNSSVYLPLRIIGEALGLTVSWDGVTSTVYLSTGK